MLGRKEKGDSWVGEDGGMSEDEVALKEAVEAWERCREVEAGWEEEESPRRVVRAVEAAYRVGRQGREEESGDGELEVRAHTPRFLPRRTRQVASEMRITSDSLLLPFPF